MQAWPRGWAGRPPPNNSNNVNNSNNDNNSNNVNNSNINNSNNSNNRWAGAPPLPGPLRSRPARGDPAPAVSGGLPS